MAGNFSRQQLNQLVGLGYLVENLVPYNDLTMMQVISKLLSQNESTINAMLGPQLVPGMSTMETLQTIQAALIAAPHNSTSIRWMIGFTIMTAAAIPFVWVRFYTRKYITPKELRIEDWSCLVGYIFCVVLCISWYILCTAGNAGNHIYDIALNDVRLFVQIIFGSEIVFYLTHFFVKIAFLVFYWKLYPNKGFQRCIIAVGFYIFGLTISGIATVIFQCAPIGWWNHLITAKCVNLDLLGIIHATFYIVADIFLLLLLTSAVWKLQLKTKDKLQLIGVFGVGAVICILSVLRTIKLKEWLGSSDLTYSAMSLAPWIILEVNLSVIVACAPSLKVFIFRHRYEPAGAPGTPRLNFPGASKLSWVTGGFYRPRNSKNMGEKQSPRQKPLLDGSMGSDVSQMSIFSVIGKEEKQEALPTVPEQEPPRQPPPQTATSIRISPIPEDVEGPNNV